MDFTRFEAITFDCYGTLMDWETGILSGLRPALATRGLSLSDNDILARYAVYESEAEAGVYQTYREALRNVACRFFTEQGATPTDEEENCLVSSFADWRPFPDTVPALRAMQTRYRLAIISNVDDDLFALTLPYLEVTFDQIITAQQAHSYKPSLNNFHLALERLRLPTDKVLHVAESLYHDIAPARSLGITNVWINRRQGKPGSGASARASVTPDLEAPDLRTLTELMNLI